MNKHRFLTQKWMSQLSHPQGNQLRGRDHEFSFFKRIELGIQSLLDEELLVLLREPEVSATLTPLERELTARLASLYAALDEWQEPTASPDI